MGECVSLCEKKKDIEEEEDNKREDLEESEYIKNIEPESLQRSEKNKTRIPKTIISKDSKDDEEEDIIEKLLKSGGKNNNFIYDKEKTKIAKQNWEYLVDKLISKRIDILREIVKKEKEEDSDEDDEKENIEKGVEENTNEIDKSNNEKIILIEDKIKYIKKEENNTNKESDKVNENDELEKYKNGENKISDLKGNIDINPENEEK